MSQHPANPTYDKQDEHIVAVAKNVIGNCQKSQKVVIDKAHDRIDKTEDRLFILDNPETGKVSVMWEDRKAVSNTIRNGLIIGVVLVSLSAYFGFRGSTKSAQMNIENIVKIAVKEAVKAVKE